MKMNWAALSAILFGLLLLFELYRYFRPLREAKRKREEKALLVAESQLGFCVNQLKNYRSMTSIELWNWLDEIGDEPTLGSLPRKLKKRHERLRDEISAYHDWRIEAEEFISLFIQGKINSFDKQLDERLMDLWSNFDIGSPMYSAIIEWASIPEKIFAGNLDAREVKDTLYDKVGRDKKGKDGTPFREFLEKEIFDRFLKDLRPLVKQPTIQMVKSTHDQALTSTQHLLEEVQSKLRKK